MLITYPIMKGKQMNRIVSVLTLALALTSVTLLSTDCGGKAVKAAPKQPAAENKHKVQFTLPEELVGKWVLFSDISEGRDAPDELTLNADGSGTVDDMDFTWKVIDSRLVLKSKEDEHDENDVPSPKYTVEGMRFILIDEDGDRDVFVKKEYADVIKKGFAFANDSDYDNAVAEFSKAVRLDPGFANIYSIRGSTYFMKPDYDKAIADFSEFIRLEPDSAVGYACRSAAYSRKKDYDNAIADLTKYIELEPNDATGYNNRGWDYCLKGEYDRGLEDIEKAMELDDEEHYIYHSRGYAYSGKKEYDKAIADFTVSLRLKRTDEAFTDRGKAYIETGDYAAAVEDFESALEINPEYPGAAEGLEKAKGLLAEKEKEASKKGKTASKKTK